MLIPRAAALRVDSRVWTIASFSPPTQSVLSYECIQAMLDQRSTLSLKFIKCALTDVSAGSREKLHPKLASYTYVTGN